MRLLSASRIDSSSSMTNTLASTWFMMLSHARRNRKLKDSSARRVCRGPEPSAVRLDDSTTYSQAHAHAVGFSRKERIEHTIDVRRVKPFSGITHSYKH